MTLAADFRDGLFYRPLLGATGYGGTRYFPLHFVLHGFLMKLGAPADTAGYALAVVSTAALLVGGYLLLRALGVQPMIATAASILILAVASTQLALVSPRGDALPAALGVWGLAVGLRSVERPGRIWIAALLFTLAFAAKFTSVFCMAALTATFAVQRRWRFALELLGATLAGYGLVLSGTHALSGGRALENFRSCAAGGLSLRSLLLAPLQLASAPLEMDPASIGFLCTAAAGLLSWRRAYPVLPAIYFLATAAVTMVIVSAPGADLNHLIDLHVAALLLIATWVNYQHRIAAQRFAIAALAFSAIFAVVPIVKTLRHPRTASRRLGFPELVQMIQRTNAPVLAENPALPLMAGRRPYLLDAFMFRVIRLRNPSFATPLLTGIRDQRFGSVILSVDPRTSFGQTWYRNESFGDPFVENLFEHYEFSSEVGGQFVYLPRHTLK
jgi:hypothetical protein